MNTSETWKSVVGWEELYEVSDYGRVRALFVTKISPVIGRILKPEIKPNGYFYVTLYRPRKCRTVHSLVLEAFREIRPQGKVCRHLDGIQSHNELRNLKWGTQSENLEDARRHGTMAIGEKCAHSKLTPCEVRSIRALRASGALLASIGKRFAVSESVVSEISNLKAWRHV